MEILTSTFLYSTTDCRMVVFNIGNKGRFSFAGSANKKERADWQAPTYKELGGFEDFPRRFELFKLAFRLLEFFFFLGDVVL